MKNISKILLAAILIPALLLSCKKDSADAGNIKLSKSSITFGSGASSNTLIVDAQSDWAIEPSDSWITVTPLRGSRGRTTATVSVKAYEGTSQRTGKLTITNDGKTYPVDIIQNSGSEVSMWIYDELCTYYYWNAAVKAATPDYTPHEDYNDFLSALLPGLNSAKDSDGTMDGGYDWQNKRYIYSYIDQKKATRADDDGDVSFGFGIEPFTYTVKDDPTKTTYYTILVTWVRPEGPADAAGVKRGMFMDYYRGARMTRSEYLDFLYQYYYLDGGTLMKLAEEKDSETYSVTARTMSETPVLYKKVITRSGKPTVGYLVYNEFEFGKNNAFDNEVRAAFKEFKDANVNELVLDLRYNGGGYVSCCRMLTSLIADGSSGKVFAKYKYNDSRSPKTRSENYYVEANSLKRTKVYVLATGYSASASEMVINSLRGIDVEVIHIGDVTEGKNVGMERIPMNTTDWKTIGDYQYEMWPISFRIYNAKENSDYAKGFKPTYAVDEFRQVKYVSDSKIFDFGDPEEELLKAALAKIDGGDPVTDDKFQEQFKAVRSVSAAEVLGEAGVAIQKPFRGGAKLLQSDFETADKQ